MMEETFYNQYQVSKQYALDAIAHNYNVVLFGKGSNGKTHLTNELIQEGHLDTTKYRVMTLKYEFNHDSNTQKYWIECNTFHYAMKFLQHESFFVINMDSLVHPDHKNRNNPATCNNTPWYYGNVVDAYGHC